MGCNVCKKERNYKVNSIIKSSSMNKEAIKDEYPIISADSSHEEVESILNEKKISESLIGKKSEIIYNGSL